MDVRLKPFDFAQAAARAGLSPDGQPLARAKAATGADFQQAMAQALKGVSLEETMLAMQQAQIGFQGAIQVRNRLVQAYTDIMNMQV